MKMLGRVAAWWRETFDRPDEWDPEMPEGPERGDTAPATPARPVRPLEAIVAFPREFKDARFIAQSLSEGKVTLLSLSQVDESEAQRIIDFISGAVYLLHGQIQLCGDVLLCTPDSVRVEKNPFRFRLGEEPVFRIKNE